LKAYVAPWWLPGGHLQTILPALAGRRYHGDVPRFERERWTTPDGDFVDVDFCRAAPSPPGTCLPVPGPALKSAAPALAGARAVGGDARRPLLVLFHGLEGSSGSAYAQAFAAQAKQRGWDYAVPHFRGCSGELNRAPRAYHSGDHEEIGWILAQLRAQGSEPLLAVGVSLGGNALLRWAQESGAAAALTVRAVAAVSAPLDLAAGGHALGKGFGRQVYTRMFLRSMKPKALAKLAQHPGLFDRERLLAAADLHAFDDVFTAPLHGFRDADDYWARCSSKPRLNDIRIPALVLNAANDPFVPAASLPRPQDVRAPVELWQPAHGGHVGFPTPSWPLDVQTMPAAVVDWLASRA